MKKLHLMVHSPNDPWLSVTHCGITVKGDHLHWTLNRQALLRHANPCKLCVMKSVPERPMPAGHAARELDKLEYHNRLHRDPPEVKITDKLQRKILKYLEQQSAGTTTIALDLLLPVSTIAAHLEQLRLTGVIYKIRGTWEIVEEPIGTYFTLVDPANYAVGRIIRK